ncbi:hypothetical protein CH267_17750 [Rhodococcus sp. 06-621-2]|nr:hypothetical protein CH267_17750 [Rhodococcus sp. 06-621-2]
MFMSLSTAQPAEMYRDVTAISGFGTTARAAYSARNLRWAISFVTGPVPGMVCSDTQAGKCNR